MEIPETYRAYQYDNYGTPEEELKMRTAVPRPALGAKQVRIKVHSAAVNPIDYVLMEVLGGSITGKTPTPDKPFGVGFDAAGTVVEVGSDAQRLKVGDAVYAMTPFDACGTFADFVAVDEEFVAKKPGKLNFDQAASLPLVALTSYQALTEQTKLQKGETLLVLGGSSSVGIVAVQLARAMGARVIATVSAKNADFVRSLGAHQVIDYHQEKWVDVLEKHSVDVVYDCGMEAEAWNHDAQVVLKKNTGRFVSLLHLAEPVQGAKFGATNLGFMLVHPSAQHLDVITQYVESGQLVPVVDSVLPFERVLEAIEKVKTRHARGKLVIQVSPEMQS